MKSDSPACIKIICALHIFSSKYIRIQASPMVAPVTKAPLLAMNNVFAVLPRLY